MTDAMRIATYASPGEGHFRERLAALKDETLYNGEHEASRAPRILELGTLRWDANLVTHHKEWAPDCEWTLSDISPGTDVDVVADAHRLHETFHVGVGGKPARFDAYIAVSLYEHLERPWYAAMSAFEVLRPGGLLYVATHQTFPLHGYPDDFFRFSDKALALIFEDAGFEILHAGYAYPCQIIPPPEVTRWNPSAPAWLNVEVAARKP